MLKKLIKIALASLFSAGLLVFFTAPKVRAPVHPKWVLNLETLLKESRVKAFLDVIAYAEGTLHINGYNTLYGGQVFYGYSDHPRKVLTYMSRRQLLKSSAAGRYQILQRTWDMWAPKLCLKNFGPESQDKLALALIRQMGALYDVVEGRFELAIKKVSPIWASLPGASYNQPMLSLKDLKYLYHKRLQAYKK
ncbi:glycoside hydrolase family 104 protein [Candidatus Dependentiae bacterium]|nr:glycoside hydrolase family 104 protein [Candidatus Dependentiae bacterium]